MIETDLEPSLIALAETLKAMLELYLHRTSGLRLDSRKMSGFFFMPAQQILRHGRHQGSRKQVRSQHGEHHRFRQRHKQIPRHAGEEKHRHEHDADRQRGNERRNRNLLRAIQNGVLDFLSLSDVAVDVLDLDRGVVDQNADRQRQSAQRHDVDRLAQRAQRR